MAKNDITQTWGEYQQGVDYKQTINLFKTVDENLRFYDGDQWYGIKAPNMPKPVFNFIKPACRFMTVQIKDRKLALKYVTEGEREDVQSILNQMNEYADRTWDRLRMDQKNLDGLTDAFNTGDYILYHWWDEDIETGQPFKGDVNSMVIDNVNYYPGNPNKPDVQTQPYIIIAMRDMVSNVRAMAKANGVSAANIKKIVPDDETDYVAGDMGKHELDGGEKCNVLLRMWKEDGQVWFSKSTKYVQILKPAKAQLKLYPIAMMNWMPRKNCCHGVAETSYMKANQVYLNKQMAFTQLHLLQTAYPKVLFNKTVIPEWSNKVASAVGVNGEVGGAARYMNPPALPTDVWVGVDKTLRTTMELMGVNDAAMGNISNPNNKSAFIAVRDAAIVPLESQQQRYYNMMRDVGMIYMDFWINHYPEDRMIPMEQDGQVMQVPFDMSQFEDMLLDTRVEVGESHMWSELNVVRTLDNLLARQIITPVQYFERMPEGYIPKKEGLLDKERQAAEQAEQAEQQQKMMQMMASVPKKQAMPQGASAAVPLPQGANAAVPPPQGANAAVPPPQGANAAVPPQGANAAVPLPPALAQMMAGMPKKGAQGKPLNEEQKAKLAQVQAAIAKKQMQGGA